MEELKTAQGLFNYYTEQVNEFRAQEKYDNANEYLDMLTGAMSMFNALQGTECTLEEDENGKISVTVYEED